MTDDTRPKARDVLLVAGGMLQGLIAGGFVPVDRTDQLRHIANALLQMCNRDRLGMAMLAVNSSDRDLDRCRLVWERLQERASDPPWDNPAADALEEWRNRGEAFLDLLFQLPVPPAADPPYMLGH